MSLRTTPGDVTPATAGRSKWIAAGRRIASVLPTLPRLLIGFMLTMGGRFWLVRPDPAGYLTDALTTVLDDGLPVGFYRPFLESVVLPRAALFAALVGWGELLSGLSIFFGAATRFGAAVATFQLINYGLMSGLTSVASHAVIVSLLGVAVYWDSGRRFGVDRWLHRRWPNARIW